MDSAAQDLLNRKDMVNKFKVTGHTIRRWERELGLPVHKIGAQRYYRRDEVDAWVESTPVIRA